MWDVVDALLPAIAVHGPQPDRLPDEVSLWLTLYSYPVIDASEGSSHERVTLPSPAVAVRPAGASGGAAGVYGPTVAESVHSLQPLSFPARTPTMMFLALSALNVMLVV